MQNLLQYKIGRGVPDQTGQEHAGLLELERAPAEEVERWPLLVDIKRHQLLVPY